MSAEPHAHPLGQGSEIEQLVEEDPLVQVQVSLEPQEVLLALEAEPTIQELKVEEQEAVISIAQEALAPPYSPRQFRNSCVGESITS